jgi:hypothetical protein
MILQPLPTLRRQTRGAARGRLDYGYPPYLRPLLACLSLVAALVGKFLVVESLPRASWWGVALLLLFALVSEDRWSFLGGASAGPEASPGGEGFRGVRRRFGLLPFARSWELSLDRVECVALKSGGPGETPSGEADEERGRMEASLLGMGRGDWAALVLRLVDGRYLVLVSGKPRLGARLASDGEAIARELGLDFVDARK